MICKTEWEKRGKEAAPTKTIEKIASIIKDFGYNIICSETKEQSLEDCFSCRISFSDGAEGFAANGKGMTRELSLASAHGELIERTQNRMFSLYPRRDDEKYDELLLDGAPLYDPLTGENEAECMTELIKKLAKTVKTPSIFMTDEEIVRDLLSRLSCQALGNKISTIPFYSLKTDRIEYIPEIIYLFTASNGMAAGNTYEEAAIEGISELVERYAQAIIMDGNVIPPQIPRDYIAEYPHIMKVIDDIEESGRYKVRLLDCSLGMQLPVVCGLIIDTETGSFGAKYGAQPNIAIAMERVFTEAMQGSSLENFSRRSYPDVGIPENIRRRDKWNNMKVSLGSVTSQLLMNQPTYEFKPWNNVDGMSNREIMMSLIRLLEKLGADVYVRDAGYLGFPCVNIYATGISEVRPVDIPELKMEILMDKVGKYFTRIDTLSDDEVKELALCASLKMGAVLENTIASISQLYFKEPMPVEGCETEFLYAACQYRLGNKKAASEMFGKIAKGISAYSSISRETRLYALGVHYYIAALSEELPEHQAFDIIYNLCGNIAFKIREQFKDRMTVLSKIYPVCGGKPLSEITEGRCQYKLVHDVYRKLLAKENENPMQIDKLRKIFK